VFFRHYLTKKSDSDDMFGLCSDSYCFSLFRRLIHLRYVLLAHSSTFFFLISIKKIVRYKFLPNTVVKDKTIMFSRLYYDNNKYR
jgi:hypothetical protein